MKPEPNSPIPAAAPWTGAAEPDIETEAAEAERDRVTKPGGEKVKDVVGGRNLPGKPDTDQKGKKVRIPRSNQR